MEQRRQIISRTGGINNEVKGLAGLVTFSVAVKAMLFPTTIKWGVLYRIFGYPVIMILHYPLSLRVFYDVLV